jgi:hypothetical protein
MKSDLWKRLNNKERFQIKDLKVGMGYDFYRSEGEMLENDPIYRYPFYSEEDDNYYMIITKLTYDDNHYLLRSFLVRLNKEDDNPDKILIDKEDAREIFKEYISIVKENIKKLGIESDVFDFSTIGRGYENSFHQKCYMVIDSFPKEEWEVLLNNYDKIFN